MTFSKPYFASSTLVKMLLAGWVVTGFSCSDASSDGEGGRASGVHAVRLEPALESFLREPPHLPEGLREVAVRTWRDRLAATGGFEGVREALRALDGAWRRDGLLFADRHAYERALSARLADVQRRVLDLPEAEAAAVRSFHAAFLDPETATTRRLALHEAFEASLRLTEVVERRAPRALGLAMQRAGLLEEAGWNRLEKPLGAEVKALEKAFQERYVAPYHAASRKLDEVHGQFRKKRTSRSELDRARNEARQRERAMWAARSQAVPTWRRLFELGEADWQALSDEFELAEYERRPLELEALRDVMRRVVEGESEALRTEARELLAREHALRTTLPTRQAWANGETTDGASLREAMRIALEGLERLRARERELVAAGARDELDALRSSIAEVQRLVDELAILTEAALRDLRSGVDEEIADVEAVLASDPREATAALRQEVARDLFYGDAATIKERIEGLSQGTTLYEPLSDEGRSEMLVALERHQEQEGGDEKPDPKDPARARQQKWGQRIQKVESAAKAAHDVTEMLVHLDVIDVEDANKVLRGLDGVHAGLTILTGLTSGNPFDVISGTAQLVMILSGKEPPPSPEEVRHEQIMEAMTLLAEGQQHILDALQVVSDQIHALHVDLNELQQIARSTHQLLIDAELQGLRKAQEFETSMAYYAARPANVPEGTRVSDGPSGFANWEQMRAHFQKHRDEYRLGRRFLDDQVSQEPLEILRIAKDPEQARELEARLGRKPGWLKSLVIADEERLVSLRRFVEEVLDPELRSAILGSLVTPVADAEGLEAKLRRLATRDAMSLKLWRDAYGRTVERGAWELENPILIADLAESLAALHDHRLLGALENDALPAFDDLLTPGGYDPATTFGAEDAARFDNLVKPLVGAERLLERALAQSALVQGDVLIPILAFLALSDEQRFEESVSAQAEQVLARSPILRHNAVRFLVHVQLHHDDEGVARIRDQVLALLHPDVRATHYETVLLAPVERRELREGYAAFVSKPVWTSMFFPGREGMSNRQIAVRIDQRLWNQFGKMVYGLDLRVMPPLPGWEKDLPVPDERLGSQAVVLWIFKDASAKEGARMLPLRLPGRSAALSGELLESDAMPLLRRARTTLRSTWTEMALEYARDQEGVGDRARLRREAWLRALYRAVS